VSDGSKLKSEILSADDGTKDDDESDLNDRDYGDDEDQDDTVEA
jgi:hypothetical protein